MSSNLKTYREDENGLVLGLNTNDDPVNLLPGQSPLMLNVNYDGQKKIRTRYGYELVNTADTTGGYLGALPYYRTYGTNNDNYILMFHSDGKAYVSTQDELQSKTAPTSAGSYGVADGRVRGAVLNNIALYGNGNSGNVIQKWEGTGTSVNLANNPPDAKIFGVYKGRIYGAGVATAPTNIYYSDADDPEANWGTNTETVNKGDGDDVTGLIPHTDALIILKERSKHALNVVFDDAAALSAPTVMPIVDSSGGAIATDSIAPVYGEIFYLSPKGFQKYGTSPEGIDRRIPNSLSYLIKPTVDLINYSKPDLVSSVYYDEKYHCAVPLGKVAAVNNTFVWDNIYKAWTLYEGLPVDSFFTYKGTDNVEEMYFTSHNEPKLFKMNKTFSDDGIGYTRRYRTRTHRYGRRTRWVRLVLNGSKVFGKDINLDVTVDETTARTKITDDDLIKKATGEGYIGDNYTGSEYLGAGKGSEEPMYKWTKYYDFPEEISEGRDMAFQLNNNTDGGGWSFDLDYETVVEHLSGSV